MARVNGERAVVAAGFGDDEDEGDAVPGESRVAARPRPETLRQAREGPVWPEETDLVAGTFVQPMGYLRARSLMARHLLLLTGESGSGKRTLALHLMQDQYVENIVALDVEDDLTSLTVRRRTGYVIDSADPDALGAYASPDLELLRQRLAERDSVLLVTCAVAAQELANWGSWRVPCQRPDPIQVLRSHLGYRLGEDWERRHLDLLDEDVVELVRTDGRPARAAAVACDLAEVAGGRFSGNDVLNALRDRRYCAVEDWLRGHPAYADWALMIAAAVFEGQDYGVVTERATALRTLLARRLPHPDGEPAEHWPPKTRDERLRSIHAVLDEQDVTHGRVRHRLDRLRFARPHWASAVRGHVWAVYPDLRDVLLDWLAETPRQPAEVHRVAGLAAGGFIAVGRGHHPLAPVERWARAGDPQRPLAVLALRAAAQDVVVATQVRRLLELWGRERTDPQLRLVAARAYPGLASVYPGPALADLLKLAGAEDPAVAAAARDGLLDLCRVGMRARSILAHLDAWDDRVAAAELAARLVWDDPSGEVLTGAEFTAVVRRAVGAPQAYAVVLRLCTALLAMTETDPGLAVRLRGVFATLFRPGRGHGLDRLAYDLARLAYEGLPGGAVIDIEVLEPAINAFEEPVAQPNGEQTDEP